MAPRLPRDLVAAVVEALWADVEEGDTGDSRDETADAAFVALACTSREVHELCAPLRWRSVEVRSQRSIATVEMMLSRPLVIRHVREVTIWIPVGPGSHMGPAFAPEDVDVLITLLGRVDGIERFCLSIQPGWGEEEDDDEDIRSAAIAFRRMFLAFARVDRPHLDFLQIEGNLGRTAASLPATALGAVMSHAPGLSTCSLAEVALNGATLGLLAGVRPPRITDFAGLALDCSLGVAAELGGCLGAHTVHLTTCATDWRVQRALVTAISLPTAPSGPHGSDFNWTFGRSAGITEDDAIGPVRAVLEGLALPGVEALYTSTHDGQALLHRSDAEWRRFYVSTSLPAKIIADRLGDRTYGRSLQRLVVYTSERDAQLEAACDRRRIGINYRLCVAVLPL